MSERQLPPWAVTELKPVPEPVPELAWCARCRRVNPRPGYPSDQDGHDWVEGLDGCAYVAGVVCPGCITPGEHVDFLVHGHDLYGGIFIDPADEPADE